MRVGDRDDAAAKEFGQKCCILRGVLDLKLHDPVRLDGVHRRAHDRVFDVDVVGQCVDQPFLSAHRVDAHKEHVVVQRLLGFSHDLDLRGAEIRRIPCQAHEIDIAAMEPEEPLVWPPRLVSN